eukprot:TRINITY_DN802_c0_g2_i1.p1 TRINITY_DN802_c0_g2~~TRINITY_DN802_c0_g2_i1.p1  ORF type:complete len:180 (-),score=44.12 TRINITY_DN802_c0_g2_i1:554-1093(-)
MALQPFFGRNSLLDDPFFSSNFPLSPFEEVAHLLTDPLIQQARAQGSIQPRVSSDVASLVRTAVDVKEDKDGFKFLVDLPGLKKEEVKVSLEEPEPGKRILFISGERQREEKTEEESYLRVERTFGKFSRRFALPSTADVSKITAKCEHGVLTVGVPKIPETPKQPKATEIPIEGGETA